jgi:DNA-binding NarL/FixJ family response regulator
MLSRGGGSEHQPDVILMDTELSECSSIEAIERIRERLPNTNIIVLSHSEADGALLSKREHDVLALVAQGFTNREIAATLVMSEHTVKVHMRNIMEKLHAHTRQQAVALARETAITKSNPGCAKQV